MHRPIITTITIPKKEKLETVGVRFRGVITMMRKNEMEVAEIVMENKHSIGIIKMDSAYMQVLRLDPRKKYSYAHSFYRRRKES